VTPVVHFRHRENLSTTVVAFSDSGEGEEEPTEMQMTGDGQEIADNPTVTPVATTG
jgi:hypothetical protein